MNQEDNNNTNFSINPESGAIGFGNEMNNLSSTTTFEEQGTFCRVGSEMNGFLEVDLQSIKQKGLEIRNISVAIPLGLDENNQPIKAEMLFMDEDGFEKFKSFIAKLNWND